MKKFILLCTFLVLCASTTIRAQVPTDVDDFNSHGIHVILRHSNANDVIAAYLGVEGGLAYGETQNPVLAQGTADVLAASGSVGYPKTVYRDTMAKLSSSINGSGDLYSMGFQLRTITPSWDRAWNVLSDMLLHPVFDTTEMEKLRAQAINAIESRESDPESYSEFLVDSIWKGSSPLNRVSRVSDVEGIQLSDLSNYLASRLQRSRMMLVVVGKVTKADLEKKLAAFAALPQGTPAGSLPIVMPPARTQALFIDRDLPTTYYVARFPSAYLGEKDWWAERLMFEIMGKRLFDEVRTKRNLSYAPGGYPNGTHRNYFGTITLQSVLPDSAHAVVIREVEKFQKQLVPSAELEQAKQSRITTLYYRMQTNADQAKNLYQYQIESGDWRNLFRAADYYQKVTAPEVQQAANRYMRNFQFVVLGPPKAVTREKYMF